jgi:pimeloyl-ACP methyl ester carboxylesterase
MAQVVLVHGIAQQQQSADSLERDWLPDLAGGVRTAGYAQIADRLWRTTGQPGGIVSRMAFYGDLFLAPGRQGPDDADFSDEQRRFAERLAQEWLRRAITRSSRRQDQQIAEVELAYLQAEVLHEQGSRELVRKALASVARIPWFVSLGMNAAQLVRRSLGQVTRYLTEDDLREQVLGRVAEHLDDDTLIVLGHSLGSVVAFEATHRLSRPLPLLITLGSPLGLRTVIYERLRPQPPTYPGRYAAGSTSQTPTIWLLPSQT